MFGKRIRSSYHKRVLEWLIDAGGSVSDIAQALDLRMPHASLALRQLRDSGDILRDDLPSTTLSNNVTPPDLTAYSNL